MIVGERLRAIRVSKNMSQGDIEKCTGLLRCYLSRVENGHTVPAVETLEKIARSMDVQLYQLFFEPNGQKQPQALDLPKQSAANLSCNKDVDVLSRLGKLVARMDDRDKEMLVAFA